MATASSSSSSAAAAASEEAVDRMEVDDSATTTTKETPRAESSHPLHTTDAPPAPSSHPQQSPWISIHPVRIRYMRIRISRMYYYSFELFVSYCGFLSLFYSIGKTEKWSLAMVPEWFGIRFGGLPWDLYSPFNWFFLGHFSKPRIVVVVVVVFLSASLLIRTFTHMPFFFLCLDSSRWWAWRINTHGS